MNDREITTVQVKKFRSSTRAATSHTFSELVTQLSQAAEKPLPTLEGQVTPSQVVFVTPYQIDTRSLASRFERYEELRRRRLLIIDGTKLAHLVRVDLPDVARKFRCDGQLPTHVFERELTNRALLEAIQSNSQRSLSSFYTDIDFSLGHRTTKLLLVSNLRPERRELTFSEDGWNLIRHADELSQSHFGVRLLSDDYNSVIDRAQTERKQMLKNKKLFVQLNSAREDKRFCEEWLEEVVPAIYDGYDKRQLALRQAQHQQADAIKSLERLQAQKTICNRPTLQQDLCDAQLQVDQAGAKTKALLSEGYHPTDIETIRSIIKRDPGKLGAFKRNGTPFPKEFGKVWRSWSPIIRQASKDASNSNIELMIRRCVTASSLVYKIETKLGSQSDFVDALQFRTTIDSHALCRILDERRKHVTAIIQRFNAHCPSREELTEFLENCHSLFEHANQVLMDDVVVNAIGLDESTLFALDNSTYRLSIPIHRIFDTGKNIALLGEAGAGKTTALQMYAKKIYGVEGETTPCFYIQLGRMVSLWIANGSREEHSALATLEDALAHFISDLGAEIQVESLRELLSRAHSILLLDGLDEAIRAASWLPASIREIASHYSSAQVIITSRLSGSHVNRLPFLTITLMPFNEEQQRAFFSLWFGEKDKATTKRILTHLKRNTEIREVVRNPLLATILCELAASKSALPQNEVRLYDDRIELLTGRYDKFKGGPSRLKARRQDLVRAAQRLAFWLHSRELRQEAKEILYEVVTEALQHQIPPHECRSLVDELADPCEILVPMTEDGKIGFGHLRFQEHLAAYELAKMQWKDAARLIDSPWWRGVFEFYSRTEQSISRFVWHVARFNATREARATLRAMVAVRPESEQEDLTNAIRWGGKRSLSRREIESLTRMAILNDDHLIAFDGENEY